VQPFIFGSLTIAPPVEAAASRAYLSPAVMTTPVTVLAVALMEAYYYTISTGSGVTFPGGTTTGSGGGGGTTVQFVRHC
jgi:hypothetical protein